MGRGGRGREERCPGSEDTPGPILWQAWLHLSPCTHELTPYVFTVEGISDSKSQKH